MIKHILFDFGGVILNIDYNAPVRAFEALGVNNFAQLYAQKAQNELFDAFEVGSITPSQFREELNKLMKTNFTKSQMDDAWNSILLDLPLQRLDFIKQLSQKYNIYMLSNTNDIHIEAFEKTIEKTPYGNLNSLMKEVYYSSQIDLQAHETLYIEDSVQHIDAAKKLGIISVLHPTNGNLEETFAQIKMS
jgi:glucose-1-phosphatase